MDNLFVRVGMTQTQKLHTNIRTNRQCIQLLYVQANMGGLEEHIY